MCHAAHSVYRMHTVSQYCGGCHCFAQCLHTTLVPTQDTQCAHTAHILHKGSTYTQPLLRAVAGAAGHRDNVQGIRLWIGIGMWLAITASGLVPVEKLVLALPALLPMLSRCSDVGTMPSLWTPRAHGKRMLDVPAD